MIEQKVIDEFLRLGDGNRYGKLRLIYNFMIEQDREDSVAYVRTEYGTGGIGLRVGGSDYAVWYNSDGLKIVSGHTVCSASLFQTTLSWEDVHDRIQQLLIDGTYAEQAVLDDAKENALRESIDSFSFMLGDMADMEMRKEIFGDVNIYKRDTEIRELLESPEALSETIDKVSYFLGLYENNRKLMRFRFYSPDRILNGLKRLTKESTLFRAKEDYDWSLPEVFITEDEIMTYLRRGGSYSDGRISIYVFFSDDHTMEDKTDFIKNRYGTGGQSHALSGSYHTDASYDSKGLKLRRGSYDKPQAEILLKWPEVAKRVQKLIDKDQFLMDKDRERMPQYEIEQMARLVANFYHRLPLDIPRPFEKSTFDYPEKDEIPELLKNDPDGLIESMETALNSLPAEEMTKEENKKRSKNLDIIRKFVAGEYSIYPKMEDDDDETDNLDVKADPGIRSKDHEVVKNELEDADLEKDEALDEDDEPCMAPEKEDVTVQLSLFDFM